MISNLIAYSQITGISRTQKQEIAKGLAAGEEYKKVIADKENTIQESLLLIGKQDSLLKVKDVIIESKDEAFKVQELNHSYYVYHTEELEEENKSLHRKLGFWKGLTMTAVVIGTLLTLR